VANRRDAADALPSRGVDEVGVSAANLLSSDLSGDLGRIDAMRTAGEDEERLAIGAEHQAVGDRANLAAKLGGSGGRSRGRVGKLADLTLNVECG
jgi:hypothetical protein